MAVLIHVPYHYRVTGVLAGRRSAEDHLVLDAVPVSIPECGPDAAPLVLKATLVWNWGIDARRIKCGAEIREVDGSLLACPEIHPNTGLAPCSPRDLLVEDGPEGPARPGVAWRLRPHPFLESHRTGEIRAADLDLRRVDRCHGAERRAEVQALAARMRVIEGRLFVPAREPVIAVRPHRGTVYVAAAAHAGICPFSQTFRLDRPGEAQAYATWLAERGITGVAMAKAPRPRRTRALRHDGLAEGVRNLREALLFLDPRAGLTPKAAQALGTLRALLHRVVDPHVVAEATCALADELERCDTRAGLSIAKVARAVSGFAGRYRLFEGAPGRVGPDDAALAALA